MRAWTGGARTAAWLSVHSNKTDATSPNCDQPEDILHVLVFCTEHNGARSRDLPEFADRTSTTVQSIAVLFPTGRKKQRISQGGRLLQSMRKTELGVLW